MNTRQELLACVRNLPLESGLTITPEVWASFEVFWRGPVLAYRKKARDHELVYEPPADSDLCLRYISRQKLFEFAPDDGHAWSGLNSALSDNQQYPSILETCGTFANVGYGAMQAALTTYREEPPMRLQAHALNELWATEVVGRQGQDLQHVLYLWLVELRREESAGVRGYRAWLIHEVRHHLLAPDQPPRPHRSLSNGHWPRSIPAAPGYSVQGFEPATGSEDSEKTSMLQHVPYH